jgi:hypothetical protein
MTSFQNLMGVQQTIFNNGRDIHDTNKIFLFSLEPGKVLALDDEHQIISSDFSIGDIEDELDKKVDKTGHTANRMVKTNSSGTITTSTLLADDGSKLTVYADISPFSSFGTLGLNNVFSNAYIKTVEADTLRCTSSSSFMSIAGNSIISLYTSSNKPIYIEGDTLRPATNGSLSLGINSTRWSTVYANNFNSVTSTELGYVSGATSSIQTQLNSKLNKAGHTANKVIKSDGSGNLITSSLLADDGVLVTNYGDYKVHGTTETGTLTVNGYVNLNGSIVAINNDAKNILSVDISSGTIRKHVLGHNVGNMYCQYILKGKTSTEDLTIKTGFRKNTATSNYCTIGLPTTQTLNFTDNLEINNKLLIYTDVSNSATAFTVKNLSGDNSLNVNTSSNAVTTKLNILDDGFGSGRFPTSLITPWISWNGNLVYNAKHTSGAHQYMVNDIFMYQMYSKSGDVHFETASGKKFTFTAYGGNTNTVVIDQSSLAVNGNVKARDFIEIKDNISGGVAQFVYSNNKFTVNKTILSTSPSINLGSSSEYFGIMYAVNFNTVSDERVKENIQDCELGLEFIDLLKPKKYTLINDELERPRYGFMAQDILEEVGDENPPIVDISNPDSFSMNYSDLIAPMVKAIQELKAMNEALIARIEVLENSI